MDIIKSNIYCHGASRVAIESIVNDFEGFRIIVTEPDNGNRKLRIRFPYHLSCRWTDEGDLLKTLGSGPFDGSLIYIAKNSEYRQWFLEESSGKYCGNEENIKHFCLATQEYIIDVLSFDEPEVDVLPASSEN